MVCDMLRCAIENRIAIVETGADKSMSNKRCSVSVETVSVSECFQVIEETIGRLGWHVYWKWEICLAWRQRVCNISMCIRTHGTKTCTTCIRWNSRVSHCFSLAAGVRQGGGLSPLLFAIFIDTVVERVNKTLSVGCYINCICCSIFLYADDVLLLAPTISGLRVLLRTCETI